MIYFIETKHIDYKEMESILQHSDRANQWTNFGPAYYLLREKLKQYFNLPKERSIVICANGTEALFGLIRMHTFLSGHSLRWAVSSFGFYCSHQGPLYDAKIIDCNKSGLLDLNLLNIDEFDGMVVTNPFGVTNNLDKYKKYCAQYGKILICDSGSAFDALLVHDVEEAFSFHHTKPWGFGEGGCIITDSANELLLQSIINFGQNYPSNIRKYSTNAKISDISCACILQRLLKLDEIRSVGIQQYNRILRMALNFGFEPLIKREITHIPHCLPLLYHKPISIDNPYVKLHKYYVPLDDSLIACDLYNRIINFPCHKDMESVDDLVLNKTFETIVPY